MSGARFPLQPAAQAWKRALHQAGGAVLCVLHPARVKALRDPRQTLTLGKLDYWMLRAIVAAAERRGEVGALDHIHQQFWQGADAARFQIADGAKRYQRFLDHHAALITPPLQAAMAARQCQQWFEIGPGTGELLNYWARLCPTLQSLRGVECNAELAAWANSQRQDERIDVRAGDGLAEARVLGGAGTVFWSYGGVLEYFGTAVVEDYFRWIANQAHPSLLALVEPLSADHRLGEGPLSQPYGAERSYSHDYRRLAEQAGLRLCYQHTNNTGQQRWLLLVAETTTPARE